MTIELAEPVIEIGKTYTREATAVVQEVDVDHGIVEAKIVPYEVECDLGGGVHEIFSRGAFAAAVGNPSRCKVTDQQHTRSVVVGKAIQLRDEHDGLYGRLRIADTAAGRDLLTLMRKGPDDEPAVLDELSVEFQPQARGYVVTRRGENDLLLRHNKATLVGVSPVGAGAYGSNARVLAVRDAQTEKAREQALALLNSLTSGPKREEA